MDEKMNYSQVMKICGVSRKQVEKKLGECAKKEDGLTISLEEYSGEITLEITARGSNEKEARKLAKPVIRELKGKFGKNIFATEKDKKIEDALVELLKASDYTLSTAESCTGGMVASRIIDVPGASDIFREGFITYSEKAKRKRLMVKKGTLKTETAVSARTAKEMAKGGCFAAGTDVCVSVTGYAGPEGGTKDKPVGTVFIGCCVKGDVTVEEYHFEGSRREIREKAAASALALLWNCILR